MSQAQWLMRIEGKIDAHFKQADGSSRPGSDWAVGLKYGEATYKVFVRTYLNDDMAPRFKKDKEYQGQTVLGYLNDLLNSGWTPDQPHNLTITITNPANMPPEQKPRWKFW